MSAEVLTKRSLWDSYRFPIILLISIIVGSVIGVIFGERAMVLQPLGQIFLNLMFTVVVPLVFFTISSAVGNMLNMRRLGKIMGYLFAVFLATGLIAAVLILVVVKVWPPAQGVVLDLSAAGEFEAVKLSDAIVRAITVPDFALVVSRSYMLPLIVFSILFGIGVSITSDKKNNRVATILNDVSIVMMKVVDLIMYYAPIGLCAYFAALVGEFGPQLIGAYGRAMLIYYPLCFIYFVVFFPIYACFSGGMPAVRRMFRHIMPPTVTSLATQSSIATLPVNLEAAAKIGVPKDVRDLVLPIGATMHMEGSVISAMLKITFLFGLFGLEFSGAGTYVSALLISIMSGVVMSGVPGGGLIGEMLIVSLYGFPPEAFPIIATIGFLVDPPATCINVTGDTVSAMAVTRLVEGKDWLDKFPEGGSVGKDESVPEELSEKDGGKVSWG
ncbi:MAG: dicarboxylate/amino acid:cation symporter [Planctomycetota bacterium]|jgi:Na+/H+-dicarboxylate symporter|nr:dicarboxylate/amino acid:cation symporter [Planctomycetota bacterium]